MSPRVSVIVPSYNHAKYIKESLESALSQDFADLEVLVVDDGSTDDSVAIAESVSDPRLKVFRNPANVGAYTTQNAALDRASGEFVAILNSDDLWRPGKLRAQIEAMERHPEANLCYTLGVQVDEQGRELPEDQHLHWPRDEVQDLFPYLLSSNRLLASAVMFRREAVRFEPTLRYSGDWVAWLKLAEAGLVACVAKPLVAWRQHPTNSYLRSRTVTLEEIRVRRAILAAKPRWLRARPDKSVIRRALSECAVDLTALYVLTGKMRLAKASASLAVRLAPVNTVAHKRFALSFMPALLARKKLWNTSTVVLERDDLKCLPALEI